AAGQPAIERLKPLQVDAVAHHPYLAAIDAETDHFLRQLARYRYDRRRFLTRATYRGSGAAEFGDLVDVAPARGNHDGASQLAAQDGGGHAVGIEVMSIDDVEIIAVRTQFQKR